MLKRFIFISLAYFTVGFFIFCTILLLPCLCLPCLAFPFPFFSHIFFLFLSTTTSLLSSALPHLLPPKWYKSINTLSLSSLFPSHTSLWAAIGGGSGDTGPGHIFLSVRLHAGPLPHCPGALLPPRPQVQHQEHPFKYSSGHVFVRAGVFARGQSDWTTGKYWWWVMCLVALFVCDVFSFFAFLCFLQIKSLLHQFQLVDLWMSKHLLSVSKLSHF